MKKATIQQRLIAKELRIFEKDIEKNYADKKRKLFSAIKKGNIVLEIGAGTGLNFKYYPKGVKLIVVEPNPLLKEDIKEKAKNFKLNLRFYPGFVEKLPLKSNSIDFVVSTLVLCSVMDLNKSLREVKRVLKKRGRFLFIEHVVDDKKVFRRAIQNAIVLPWRFLSAGCHPNRNIESSIRNCGFKQVKMENYYQKGLGLFGWVVKSHIIGSATK